MNLKELRVGNFIQLYRRPTDENLTVHSVINIYSESTIGPCVTIEDGFNVNSDSGFKPIPLTEEWFLKFGFEGNSGTFAWKLSPAGKVINVECKYVHQLQNLYFALTGEELILKP